MCILPQQNASDIFVATKMLSRGSTQWWTAHVGCAQQIQGFAQLRIASALIFFAWIP
jgi:hypothetical protein